MYPLCGVRFPNELTHRKRCSVAENANFKIRHASHRHAKFVALLSTPTPNPLAPDLLHKSSLSSSATTIQEFDTQAILTPKSTAIARLTAKAHHVSKLTAACLKAVVFQPQSRQPHIKDLCGSPSASPKATARFEQVQLDGYCRPFDGSRLLSLERRIGGLGVTAAAYENGEQ